MQGRPFLPGEPWGGGSERAISAVGDVSYPVFWLGPSFRGYNLQAVYRENYPYPIAPNVKLDPPPPALIDDVTLIYGDCSLPTPPPTPVPAGVAIDSDCAAPVAVHVHQICDLRPEWIPKAAKKGDSSTVRGHATEQRFADGQVILWTGTVAITISTAADPSLVDTAVTSLQILLGPGQAPIGPGEQMPRADFSGCPPRS